MDCLAFICMQVASSFAADQMEAFALVSRLPYTYKGCRFFLNIMKATVFYSRYMDCTLHTLYSLYMYSGGYNVCNGYDA